MFHTQASLNIVQHAQLLGTPSRHLAAVYCDSTAGTRQQITASQVVTFLWHVAHKVFNISDGHKDPLAWSCYSIQVTAKNLLHRACFSNSFIKNHLHWHSNTVLMYLRNTFYMADEHTAAITLSLDPPTPDLARPLKPHKTILSAGTV